LSEQLSHSQKKKKEEEDMTGSHLSQQMVGFMIAFVILFYIP